MVGRMMVLLAMMTIGVKATCDQNVKLAACWSVFGDSMVGVNGIVDVIIPMIDAPLR